MRGEEHTRRRAACSEAISTAARSPERVQWPSCRCLFVNFLRRRAGPIAGARMPSSPSPLQPGVSLPLSFPPEQSGCVGKSIQAFQRGTTFVPSNRFVIAHTSRFQTNKPQGDCSTPANERTLSRSPPRSAPARASPPPPQGRFTTIVRARRESLADQIPASSAPS